MVFAANIGRAKELTVSTGVQASQLRAQRPIVGPMIKRPSAQMHFDIAVVLVAR